MTPHILTIRVAPEFHARIKDAAWRCRLSQQQFCELAIAFAVERDEEEHEVATDKHGTEPDHAEDS